MNLVKNAVLSCEILTAHKLRSLLSITGIVVGVGAVVVMVSLGESAEQRLLDRIRNLGTNLIVVNAGQTRIVAGRQRQMAVVTTLVPGDAEAIAAGCPSVTLAAAAAGRKLLVRWESETTKTNVLGITAPGFRIRNIEIGSGRCFDEQESRARRRVAVLGPTVVGEIFGDGDPIGLRIRIGRVPFEVIGVTAPKGMDVNGVDQDDLIMIPLETAMRRLLNVTHVQSVYAQAGDTQLLDRAEAEIRALLRRRHRLRGKRDDFTIQNQAALLAAESEMAQSVTLLIGSVAGISLLVGGVGILAVMLISVKERTKEIGLRRAVGASREDIRTQFLVESSLLAGAGGLLGALGGVAGARLLPMLGDWQPVIAWPAVGIAFAFAVSVGLVFGIYPATRAARLEPAQALSGSVR